MSDDNNYGKYQAASGTKAAGIAISAATEAAQMATNDWKNLPALTWDSWVRAMSDPWLGYPASAIQSILQIAWPFLPNNIRTQLSKRESPTAVQPVLPNPNMPVTQHEATKQIPQPFFTAKNIGIGAGVVGAGLLLYRIFGRKR